MMAMAEKIIPTAPEGAGPKLTYKKSIRHVVDGSHQHADDGRNGQLRDHASYRRMGHFIVLVMFFFCLFHDDNLLSSRSAHYIISSIKRLRHAQSM